MAPAKFICNLAGPNPTVMKKFVHLFLVVMICSFAEAQTKTLDSIKTVIADHPQRDTVKVSLIMDYVIAANNENTSELLPFIAEMLDISKKLDYRKGMRWGYSSAQLYYSDRGDFTNSILYADSAFAILKKDTGTNAKVSIAFLHNNLGGDYLKMGDFQQAIEQLTKAAALLEQYQPRSVATVYSTLAGTYEKLKQPQKALAYGERAIAAAEKYGTRSSIARRYVNYAGTLINQQAFAKANEVLDKIQPTVMELKESFLFVFYYQNRGYVAQSKKNHAEAVANFQKAYSYALANDDKYEQAAILNPLAASLVEAGRLAEAKTVIDSLLALSLRHKLRFGELNAYTNLAKWSMANGDYKTATQYLNRKMELADSISSNEVQEKVAMVETRFRVREKDNEIKMLQGEKEVQRLNLYQKDLVNKISLGGLAAMLIISLLVYRNYRNRQKLQQQRITELETEKQLAATEAVLKGEEQERTRLAKDLHDGLGGMLSGIKYSLHTMKGNLIMTPENAQAFERSIDMLDSSISEMRRVAHNMMPEALLKFGLNDALRDFCSDLNQSSALAVTYQSIGMEGVTIEQTKSVTVYRIVQELLNNTLKHAAAKNALVQLTYNNGELSLTVEDDGRGFEPRILNQSKGIGWSNIQNRIEFLKGKWDVDSREGTGTAVNIVIPN